jgi:hypothetical protein
LETRRASIRAEILGGAGRSFAGVDALRKNASCKGLADEPQLVSLDWDDTLAQRGSR